MPFNAVINTEPTPRRGLAAGVASTQAETLAAAIATPQTSAEAASEANAVQVAPTEDSETPNEDVVDAIAKQITDKQGAQDLRLPSGLKLKSSVVLVVEQTHHEVIAAQHAE